MTPEGRYTYWANRSIKGHNIGIWTSINSLKILKQQF